MEKDITIKVYDKKGSVGIMISNHTTTGYTAGWRLIEIKGIVPHEEQLITFQYDMLDDVILALKEIQEINSKKEERVR
jgi:hypothetical protein